MTERIFTAYAGLFCLSLVLGLLLTPLARRLALRVGLVDNPGERKIHSRTIPYGGGIAIVLTFSLVVASSYLSLRFFDWDSLIPGFSENFAPLLGGVFAKQTLIRFGAVMLGGSMMFGLGLLDDFYRLNPKPKLAVQIIAAFLVYLGGLKITLFVESEIFSAVVTVLWIVFVTNAFNLLDNMDGLSSGVAAIAASLFFVVALQTGQVFVASMLAVLAGSLFGFLYYNFAPAKLFMGDAGSLFIGFILATLTVAGTYHVEGSFFSVFMPVLILGVPFFDTLSVLYIRYRNGKPFFQGDTNHFSHRLVRLGMTRREAVLTIYLLGIILGGAATLLEQLDRTGSIIVFLIGLGIIALIVLLENAAARRGEE
ncbi:MAG: undecaprenyl/decaprenyl-phosphate alpha-N-acetylglucosaminyl 1-phosphate transferase [Planctomycetes bacterium]|nr:undecaprenyl/decaprenyl-phosphate alpha-N-acetylglucosaminyl 1-phosphate transferase [Planctomycetota bacterium]